MAFKPNYSSARLERERKKAAKKEAKLEAKQRAKIAIEEPSLKETDWSIFDQDQNK